MILAVGESIHQHRLEDGTDTPLEQFLDEFAEIDEEVDDPSESELAVPKKDLVRTYNQWVEMINDIYDYGLEEMSATKMGITLKETPQVESGKRRFEGEPKPCYVGIKLTRKGKALFNIA